MKYRNTGKKWITLNTGEKIEVHWNGREKRREATGVGFLIRIDESIAISDPDIEDPRYMSVDLKIFGFSLRVINVCSPTEDASANEKYVCYIEIKKARVKRQKKQKLIVWEI